MKIDSKNMELIMASFQKKKEVTVGIKATRQELEERGLTVVHEFTNMPYPFCNVLLKSESDIKLLEEGGENMEVLYGPEYHIL